MKILKALASIGAVLLAFWLAGFDFNERGTTAVFAYIVSVGAAWVTYDTWD